MRAKGIIAILVIAGLLVFVAVSVFGGSKDKAASIRAVSKGAKGEVRSDFGRLVRSSFDTKEKGVPSQINYQGYLVSSSDSSAITGTLEMIFKIYDEEAGGDSLWSETQTVEVSNGLFNVLLETPAALFTGQDLWLETTVEGETLSPKKKLVSIPYGFRSDVADRANQATWADSAFHAVYSDTAEYALSAPRDDDWLPDTSGLHIYRPTGNVGIGVVSMESKLGVSGGASIGSGYAWRAAPTNGMIIEGNVGIGTTSPTEALDVAGTVRMSGFELTNSPSDGYVLTSDISGVGTWQAPNGLSLLPYADTCSSPGYCFWITNSGAGPTAMFEVSNSNSVAWTLQAKTKGLGRAGYFEINNSSNNSNALYGNTNGTGNAVMGYHTGTSGCAGYFQTVNSNQVTLQARQQGTGSAGYFWIENTSNSVDAVTAYTKGNGNALYAQADGSGSAVYAVNNGSGWAGDFRGLGVNSKGVYISAPAGQTGLNVASGTKNAVVATSRGARALYSEEASEVWFADYGFGRLQDGRVLISIDDLFAETVNLGEPYHVFLQAYGNAELYVSQRTPTGFEVRLREGESNVEFSYRLVAKRRGYERSRLQHLPWADEDPNLYPEKRAEWEIQHMLPDAAKQ